MKKTKQKSTFDQGRVVGAQPPDKSRPTLMEIDHDWS